jgi:hypothetical protein
MECWTAEFKFDIKISIQLGARGICKKKKIPLINGMLELIPEELKIKIPEGND